MLSLYQKDLQENVKWITAFEENLRQMEFKPDVNLPPYSEDLKDFVKYIHDDSVKKIKQRHNKDTDKKYRWIGINPYPVLGEIKDEVLELFKKLKHKCQSTPWLSQVAFTVEAFTDGGYRPHIHLLILNTSIRPSRIIETFSKLFSCPKNMIEVATMTYDFDKKFKYLKGEKQESKIEYVINDKELRQTLGVPDIYNTLE